MVSMVTRPQYKLLIQCMSSIMGLGSALRTPSTVVM
jgi:hypothetical protein